MGSILNHKDQMYCIEFQQLSSQPKWYRIPSLSSRPPTAPLPLLAGRDPDCRPESTHQEPLHQSHYSCCTAWYIHGKRSSEEQLEKRLLGFTGKGSIEKLMKSELLDCSRIWAKWWVTTLSCVIYLLYNTMAQVNRRHSWRMSDIFAVTKADTILKWILTTWLLRKERDHPSNMKNWEKVKCTASVHGVRFTLHIVHASHKCSSYQLLFRVLLVVTKFTSSPIYCPICEVTLRPDTLATHYDQEVARIQAPILPPRQRKRSSTQVGGAPSKRKSEQPLSEKVQMVSTKSWKAHLSNHANS